MESSTFLQEKLTGTKGSSQVCEKHGKNKNKHRLWDLDFYSCDSCEEEKAAKAKKERIENEYYEKQRAIEQLFKECQIGKRFIGIDFTSYEPPNEKAGRILALCQKYADDFEDNIKTGAGLIMVGKPGTGKNHLSAAICSAVMKQGHSTVHTTVMKMIRKIKATWARDSETTEQRAIMSFCKPDLLVIDEVGVQFGSETEKLLLTEIINERYESIRPTIMLSNLPASQLSNILGERVVDRFRHGGEVLVFDWESYRRNASQEIK